MLDTKLIEREFPSIKDVVFLNSAQVSVPSVSVQDAYFSFTRDYIATFGEGVVERAWETVEDARRQVSELIGAAPAEIGFVKNTTEGVGILASGFPFAPGDNVVVIDQEHPTNLLPWINTRRRQVELRVVPSRDGAVLEEDVISRIDERTKVVAISAVQFATGAYTELTTIGRVCRERGALLAVDGIQAVGRLALDVKSMGIGYLSCGANKGLLAMLGAGFVFCDPNWVERIIPPYVSYQSVTSSAKPPAPVDDFTTVHWHNDSRRFESGNLNYAGIAAICAGARLINTLGIKAIHDHILEMQHHLLRNVRGLSLNLRSPLDRASWSGIVCVDYPAALEHEVHDVLRHHRIVATFRGGYIRLCLNFYNDRNQIDTTVLALQDIAALSERGGHV